MNSVSDGIQHERRAISPNWYRLILSEVKFLQNTLFEFLNIDLISILKSFITVKKIGISVHYFSKFWLFDPISKIPERYFRDWN